MIPTNFKNGDVKLTGLAVEQSRQNRGFAKLLIIASGPNRVDEKKVEQLIGEPIEKADAEFVLHHTSFAIGGIPPIGYELEIKPLIDHDLMQYTEIWAAAGTPFAVFRITPQELVKITDAQILELRLVKITST